MPASSKQQFKYIQYLRNKYGSKEKAPEKYKWAFEKKWTNVDYKSLPEEEISKYIPVYEMLTSGSVGESPENPMKQWQSSEEDKLKKNKKIKIVRPQGSK